MSADEQREAGGREPASWTVAGYLAALALFAGAIALVWYRGRVGTAAILIALIAAGMGGPHSRLAAATVAISTLCWLAGMIIAVIFEQPIF